MESGYKRLLYLVPFLLTLLIIPLSLIGTDKPIGDAIGELREAAQETEEISRWSYLFTQFRVIVTYTRLLFLPINQNLDYDYPLYHSFFEPEVFLSFLFLLPLVGLGIYLLYRSRFTSHASRLIAFGIFWFFITLSVESSIIPIRDVIFEHRLYLSDIGAIIAFVSGIFYILRFTIHDSRLTTYALRTCYLLLATAVIVFSIATYERNIIWQDEVSLWEDVMRKSPEKARGHNNLGLVYSNKGWLDKAIEHYQIALRLNPDYVIAYYNLGRDYSDKGLLDRAIEYYQIAVRLKPDYVAAHFNLGAIYIGIGAIDEASKELETVLQINPEHYQARRFLNYSSKMQKTQEGK